MKKLIDHLTSTTGWTVNSPSTIQTTNVQSKIAGLNTASLMIYFDEADTVKTATKTLSSPIDVSDYDTLVFSIWSQRNGEDKEYLKSTDFAYKIKIDATHEYYIPAWSTFTDVNIGIEDIDSITQIVITKIGSESDYIIVSEMIAEKEELPYDILYAVKEAIDYFVSTDIGEGYLLDTISGYKDDQSITFEDTPSYLDRYGVVKIISGLTSEEHQIDDNNGLVFSLNNSYDGNMLLRDYTDASVYLRFPAYISPGQDEIKLPGFAIWGIDPTPILRGAKADTIRDTFLVSDNSSKERTEGQIYEFNILIDCEARNQYLIDTMTRIVRKIISREVLWVNGRKHDIYFSGKPTEQLPVEGIDYIPKVQYSLKIESKENIFARSSVVNTETINIDVDIT